jgi:hypothetical protein
MTASKVSRLILILTTSTLFYGCNSNSGKTNTSAVAHPAASSATPPVTLSPRQLVVHYTCPQAESLIVDTQNFSKLDADDASEVTAVWDTCSAAIHNKLHPQDPQVVVATPDASSTDHIQILTIDKSDAHEIQRICYTAAASFFTVAETGSTVNPVSFAVVTAVDVLTDSGRTDCDSFIHGFQTGNPLVVLAPSIIAGAGVTTHILSMIGAGSTANKIQPAVDQLGNNVSKVIGKAGNLTSQGPLMYVAPQVVSTVIPGVQVIIPKELPPPIKTTTICALDPLKCVGGNGNPGDWVHNPQAPKPAGTPPRPQ